MKMNSFTQDAWVCNLCKQGTHHKGLGDLFGPYFVHLEPRSPATNVSSDPKTKVEPNECSTLPQSSKKLPNDKRKRSESSESISEKKMKTSHSGGHTNADESSSEVATSNTPSTQEVWFHEDCLVWSNGVFLAGKRIRNIEDVVNDCAETVCCKCELKGASLGCLHKGCSPRFHYLCAKEKGCEMNEENFSICCPRHKRKSKDSSHFGPSLSPV